MILSAQTYYNKSLVNNSCHYFLEDKNIERKHDDNVIGISDRTKKCIFEYSTYKVEKIIN